MFFKSGGELARFIEKEAATPNRADAADIAAYLAGLSFDELKFAADIHVSDELVTDTLSRLKAGEPAAYITSRRFFYDNEFIVSPDVLIPRYETEILVDKVLDNIDRTQPLRMLDLCTGSGCILLSILDKCPNATGVGVDISASACEIFRRNAEALGLSDRCRVYQADMTGFVSESAEKFDVVTANPPYVSEDEYKTLEKQVKFEPKTALTAGDDGLFFYKKILDNINHICNKNGMVFLETGAGQFDKLDRIYKDMGLSSILDYQQIKRVLFWRNL